MSESKSEQPLECPVNEDFIWRKVCVDGYTHFTILPKEKDEWPESRQDAIGQNGNDGEHYEKPETTHDVSHHKRKDGTDLIDEWWNKYEPEVARVLMWEMVNKYNNRLGKKDPIHIEVAKMADYMARWSEKEFELINKLGA